eukprot:6811014-Alexandrium_andersonii.AAC.1
MRQRQARGSLGRGGMRGGGVQEWPPESIPATSMGPDSPSLNTHPWPRERPRGAAQQGACTRQEDSHLL